MMTAFRALQKLETVGQASREACRCVFQGAGGWRPVHHEVLLRQVNYSPTGTCSILYLYPSCIILAASDHLDQILTPPQYIFRNDLCGWSAKIDVNSIANMDNHEMVKLQRKVMKGKPLHGFPILVHVICHMCMVKY
jgi:hypothetical protein